MGWFSNLFSEKIEIEIGGQKKWVPKRQFDEIMQKAVAAGKATVHRACTVHIISPMGNRTENWIVGDQIPEEAYNKLKGQSGDLHALEVYEKGEPSITVITKEIWQKAAEQFGAIDAEGDAAMKRTMDKLAGLRRK
ncbi:MAG: hypothetical protein HYX37_20510 [Rhizobiales bacterium]|nr:hypothetical protein [Hyphomicrobiales bacterium]